MLPEVHSMMVPPGFKSPISLSVFNHLKGHPVFHTVTRVEVFNLCIHLARKIFNDLIQFNQRRIPNCTQDVVVYVFSFIHSAKVSTHGDIYAHL